MGRRAEGAPHFAALPPASRTPRAAPAEHAPRAGADYPPAAAAEPDPFGFGPAPAPAPGWAEPAGTAAPPSAATAAVAALAAFLEGAGLEPDIATGRAPDAALREAGALFAALAGGLRDLLAMRAAMKDHAGLDLRRSPPR